MSEMVKGRESCHKTLLQIYTNGSLTQKLLGEGPIDVEDAPEPAC